MDINRALPVGSNRSISREALRQASEYMKGEPISWSFKTTCCGKMRTNEQLDDPGYYLNGGPSCGTFGAECKDPAETTIEAIADGLVPGSIVYGPKNDQQYWPAIVDFCPDEKGHFVIFRKDGTQCCVPYAYYLSYIPDWTGEIFGGWFTADTIIPFDTLVHKKVDLAVNFNDLRFDDAHERTNKYYYGSLNDRLERFSKVCWMVANDQRRVRHLISPNKSFKGRVANTAKKFSYGIVKHLSPGTYQRVMFGDAGASTSKASLTGRIIMKIFFLTPKLADIAREESNGEYGVIKLSDLSHEHDHIHPPPANLPEGVEVGENGILTDGRGHANPTEHWRAACNEIFLRCTIRAVIKSGLDEIRTYTDPKDH